MAKLTFHRLSKTAENSNGEFEKKFASLAVSELNESLPRLVPYCVGFQIIESNDEGTRGVGAMTYQVEDTWIYIPCFYLNGRLRGTNIMYLPQKGQFVPAQDNWISYVLSSKTPSLGTPAPKNTKFPEKGSINTMKDREFMTKHAAAVRESFEHGMLGALSSGDFRLDRTVPMLGKSAALSFLSKMAGDVDFANSVYRFYTPDDVERIAKIAMDTPDKKDTIEVVRTDGPKADKNVVFITPENAESYRDKLSDQVLEVITRDGAYVVDEREETSTLFYPDRASSTDWRSPSGSGFYTVLDEAGEGVDCFVAVKFELPEEERFQVARVKPLQENRPDYQEALIIVPFNNGYKAQVVDCTKLLARKSEKPLFDLKDAQINDMALKSTDESLSMRGNSKYVVIHKDRANVVSPHDLFSSSCQFTGPNGDVVRRNSTLFIPSSAKIIKAVVGQVLVPGNINTVVNRLAKTAELKSLKVWNDGVEWNICGRSGDEGRLSKTAALRSLVLNHNISAKDAKAILKDHGNPGNPRSERFLVKYAGEDTGESTLYGVANSPHTQQMQPYHKSKNIKDNQVSGLDHARSVDDSMSSKDVLKAAGAGIQDVMDVSVFRQLAKNSNPGMLIKDFLPDLLLAVDRMGRLLFMFYWKNEEIEEIYGQAQMGELEDSLRSEFHGVGDLVIFLHKNTNSDLGLLADGLSAELG